MRSSPFVCGVLTALVLLGALSACAAQQPTTYVWLEAEDVAALPQGFQASPMGPEGILSGDGWAIRTMSPQEANAQVPEGGFRFRWDLTVPEAGRYEVWARIGYEWARAPFEWRIGEGEWTLASHEEQTTNVMELGEWMEVAWLLLDERDLAAGDTTFEIRYVDAGGEDRRMLMALDCIALMKGRFVPESSLKPGEAYARDTDLQAAQQTYDLPPAEGTARSEVTMTGLWQVARWDDEDMDDGAYEPVQALPIPEEYPLRWQGIGVPLSLWSKPETIFAHRVVYRTKVNVPADHAGRGFKLHFSGTNWLASVFVNGELAGTHKGVWIPWDLDVSKHVKPGEVNELAVVIKGCYYAVDTANYGQGQDMDRHRNRPRARQDWVFFVAPIWPSSKGDGDGVDYGIVNPVTLVSVGNAYTEDVFIKPSVAERKLETDVTVRNTSDAERTVQVACEAVNEKTGEVEKTFGPVDLTVPASGTAVTMVAGDWQDPKLWWPVPEPDLYTLRTTVSEGGNAVDVQEELFGFREVTIEGPGIYINGVRRNFWNWVGVEGRPRSGEEWLEAFRGENDRFTRFSQNRKTSAFLRSREERLEFYDRNGIPGRLCSMIDGMMINRVLGERTRDPDTNEPLLIVNEPVWEGFRRHMEQLAKAYRNHPSAIFYQVENELVYITGMNIYGGYLDRVEELMSEVCEAARAIDPTRPYTVGGAGDLSGKLEINDPHYPAGSLDWYPENAYELSRYAAKIERWPWTRETPWVVGESAHAGELDYGSYVLGDEVFRSPDHARRGKARYLRMLYGGYRWAGVAGFFPWDNLTNYEDARKVFSDLCVIPRKQTHRLLSGSANEILVKVMNDTLSGAPVTFEWSYEAGGKRVAGDTVDLEIEPGFGVEQTLTIDAPATAKRLDGTLTLKATQEGAPDYIDARSVPVLPVVEKVSPKAPVVLLDRSGEVADFLNSAGVAFEELAALSEAEGKTGILLVGPDTLTADEAFGQDILRFAAQGGRAIVLEQGIPVAGANLPAPLKSTTHDGGYAHPKALGTPLFADLGRDDLIDWAGDHPTYKAVYEKPLQGGRTLVEAGGGLRYAPLIEMPCGEGAILLCQLRVGAKLGEDPAAAVLLRNMLQVYDGYKPATGVVAIYAPDNPLLRDKVKETGVLAEDVDDIAEALDPKKHRVAVINADAENLRSLVGAKQQVDAFCKAGGWVMLSGLDREGIVSFNALTGGEQSLRPFRIERVTLESPDYKLAATMGNREVSMYTTEAIAAWRGQYWVSGDVYTAVVDGRDFAPYTQPPDGPEDIWEYTPTKDDKDPYNFVNGLMNSEFWRYIRQIWIPEGGAEPLEFRLRKPETLAEVRIWNNDNYWTIKDLDIIVDGDDTNPIAAVLPASGDMTSVKLDKPVKVDDSITLQIRSWRETNPEQRLVGIDNVQFLRSEPPKGAVFLDNVGGLVAYPRGKGGIFLNQTKFMEDEPNGENVQKKLRLLGVLLQNMGAGSKTSVVAIPGVNVRFEPLTLTDYCTQYRGPRADGPGWFGQRDQDLRHFTMGERALANVTYHPVDYATAPVPDVMMLGANGAPPGLPQLVEGIKVGKRADQLYFLHTVKVTRPINDDERSRIGDPRRPFELPTVMRYIIHYADGKSAEIPVQLERHVDHWLHEEPRVLESALVAWTGLVEGIEAQKATLYSMQAPNPRPDVEIESIDVALPLDRNGNLAGNRAVPVVVGITLGTVIK